MSKQTGRQTNKQTDRQQTDRQAGSQAVRQADRQTGRQREWGETNWRESGGKQRKKREFQTKRTEMIGAAMCGVLRIIMLLFLS